MTAYLRAVPGSREGQGARLTLAPLRLSSQQEALLEGLDALQYGAVLRVLHHMVPRVRRRASHFDPDIAKMAIEGGSEARYVTLMRLLGATAQTTTDDLMAANRAELHDSEQRAMRELLDAWLLWVKASDGHDLRRLYCLGQVAFIRTLNLVADILIDLIDNFFTGPDGPPGGLPLTIQGALPTLGPLSFFKRLFLHAILRPCKRSYQKLSPW